MPIALEEVMPGTKAKGTKDPDLDRGLPRKVLAI